MNLKKEKISIIISLISLIASFIMQIDYLSWIAIILCGVPIFKECITELDIKADFLVSIAIIASILIGEVFAAGEIATIMAIGGFLEKYTVSKTTKRIDELVKLTPAIATRIRNGKEEKIDADKIKIGDILKVLPGEAIASDGVIIHGESSINQSTLTGESMPVDKSVGDEVYSGCVNMYGSFTMKTTKESKDSSLQRLIKLVESSKAENAKIVRTADRWATWIVIIALTSAILTYLFTGEIIKSVTILVVFCPCALVLATPTAIIASIGNLTKYGILVKDGKSIEELAHVDEIIFDKTGTLTYGTPEVIDVISRDDDMLYLLASLEAKSEHPLAKAIVSYWGESDLSDVEDFEMVLGKGVKGMINNNKIIAGNKALLESENIKASPLNSLNNCESEIFICKNGEVIGKVTLADTLRKNSKESVESLKQLGIKTTLLTGDNENSGGYIAREVNISNAKFNCLAEDKCRYISKRQHQKSRIAMIGDGINDAASLKKANVGIAMGSIGSDLSIESADITLINDNIGDLAHLIGISRKALRTININIAFSLILNTIAMILAISGILNPVASALVHNIGSVTVILYSGLLVNYKDSPKKLGMTKNLNKINSIYNDKKHGGL